MCSKNSTRLKEYIVCVIYEFVFICEGKHTTHVLWTLIMILLYHN